MGEKVKVCLILRHFGEFLFLHSDQNLTLLGHYELFPT